MFFLDFSPTGFSVIDVLPYPLPTFVQGFAL